MAITHGKRQEAETEPTFADCIPHERIDAEEGDDIYVVGDVHGCRAELEALLDRLDVTSGDSLVPDESNR